MRLLFLLLLIPFLSFGQATESDIQTLIDNIGSPLTPARVKGAMTAINTGKQSIVGMYSASGTNTYTVTVGSGITNNDAGKIINVRFVNANTTGPATLNVNGIGALPLKTNLGSDHDVGGLCAGCGYQITSTGTTWQVIGPTNEGGEITTEYGEIGGSLPDQTDLYDTLNTKARKVYKIKVVSTNYTASLGDHDNKLIIVNGGAAFEIPKDADVDFPIGATLLAADSLGTATWTKDPAVRIDTLDFTHAWTKLAADHWGFYKGAGSGGSGAYWPLTGTAALIGDVEIPGANHNINLGSNYGYDIGEFNISANISDMGFTESLYLHDETENVSYFMDKDQGHEIVVAGSGHIYVNTDGAEFYADDDKHSRMQSGGSVGDLVRIDVDNTAGEFVITDDRATKTGIQYAADYAANYTNRSLVDKEYVDDAVAGGGGGTLTTANFVFNEVPSGTVNGSNTAFTIANTPTSGTVQVYLNGLRQKGGGVDYSISGATITFVTAPETGDLLITDYMK